MPSTILVVDHVSDLREMYRAALDSVGFTVIVAKDGEAALAAVAEHAPAVVVMHVGLPDIDGVSLGRRINHDGTGRAIPILAITGWPGRAEEFRLSAAFTEVLIKPVLPGLLIEAVERCVANATLAPVRPDGV